MLVSATVFLILCAFTGYASDHDFSLMWMCIVTVLDIALFILSVLLICRAWPRKSPGVVSIAVTLFCCAYLACPMNVSGMAVRPVQHAEVVCLSDQMMEIVPGSVPLIIPDGNGKLVSGYVVGHLDQRDRLRAEDGRYLVDDAGNLLVAIELVSGQKILMAQTLEGQIVEPQTSVLLCIVVGTAVLVGGGYAAYKINCWAKKTLYPPPPPPPPLPTNTIPTNTNPPNPPKLRANGSFDGGCVESSWTDWQGNPMTNVAFGKILSITNDDGSGPTNYLQSSTDLIHWTIETFCMTSYMSGDFSVPGRYSVSNSTTIFYDQYGIPFATNWACGTNQIASQSGVPRRAGVPMLFFRLAPAP